MLRAVPRSLAPGATRTMPPARNAAARRFTSLSADGGPRCEIEVDVVPVMLDRRVGVGRIRADCVVAGASNAPSAAASRPFGKVERRPQRTKLRRVADPAVKARSPKHLRWDAYLTIACGYCDRRRGFSTRFAEDNGCHGPAVGRRSFDQALRRPGSALEGRTKPWPACNTRRTG
jgi:hypothetical protein